MPGLVSTLLNQAYSIPSREVHTFLQVTEQVWQPMHLSRLSTIAICARTFIVCLLACGLRHGYVHPIDLRHLAHDDELVAIGAHRAVVVEAVCELRVTADHVRRLHHRARHRVVDAAACAGDLRAGHVHDLLLRVVHETHAFVHSLAHHRPGGDGAVHVV